MHFRNNKFSLHKKILDQPVFFNLQTKLNLCFNDHNFYSLSSNTFTDNCTKIGDLCIFLKPGFLSYTSWPCLNKKIRSHSPSFVKELIQGLFLTFWAWVHFMGHFMGILFYYLKRAFFCLHFWNRYHSLPFLIKICFSKLRALDWVW